MLAIKTRLCSIYIIAIFSKALKFLMLVQYDFEVTYLEIYNETIQDLLGNNKKDVKHEIRLANPNSNEVYVTNLTINKVTTQQQVRYLLVHHYAMITRYLI